ncbi:MAG: hypothetical protein E7226_05075 [Clostridiales bacterium]|nr:hypothetical protein [Clostridiales bacterium]
MEQLLYTIAGLVARIHNFILSWNDSIETSFTDKELHFLVIGLFGLALILALHPLFLWLARTGHTMFITFFYVFTVIIVITFAIEIGQGVLGTGAMEQGDITYGIMGFLFFFAIFAIIRLIVHGIIKLKNKHKARRYYS